jgi:hypothetical protein
MDNVEYVSASGTFAIVRKDTPEKANPEKELQALLDMRPDKQVFVNKQLPKFLARYGRQFECDDPVSVSHGSEDARRLEELGYDCLSGPITLSSDKLGLSKPGERTYAVSYGSEGMVTFFPSMEALSGACDRYVVDLTDNKDPKSLLGTIETARYVAGLGLVSQGYASHEVKLKPKLRPKLGCLSAWYELTPPPSLRLDLEPTGNDESAEDEPLLFGATGFAVYGEKDDPTGKLTSLLEFDDEERRRWWLMVPIRGFLDSDAADNRRAAQPRVKTLPDGSPDEMDLNRLAASLLLSIIEQRYKDRPRRYVVDPTTLELKRNGAPYLVGELVRCIVTGKVHPCDRCGKPIMGGAWYCRSGRCQQATLEAARREAARGRSVDEIIKTHPHIKRATVEGYVEDERRGLQ